MRIYLRKATIADGELIVKWRNSDKVSNHCFNRNPITVELNANFYKEFVESGRYKQYIVERVDEDYGVASYPIATVYLKDIDRTNSRCELCIFTSDDGEWNDDSKSLAVNMLLDIAFKELGMHKVYSFVFAEFLDEADLLKHAGFRAEAILPNEAMSSSGAFADVIRFSVFSSDYRK